MSAETRSCSKCGKVEPKPGAFYGDAEEAVCWTCLDNRLDGHRTIPPAAFPGAAEAAREFGVPVVDPVSYPVNHAAVEKIPEEVARELCILPLAMTESLLIVAMANPADDAAKEKLAEFVDRKLEIVASARERIEQAIERFYAK